VALRRPGREINPGLISRGGEINPGLVSREGEINPGLISRGVALAAAWVVLEAHERRDPDGS
jgi:hypothetical protein